LPKTRWNSEPFGNGCSEASNLEHRFLLDFLLLTDSRPELCSLAKGAPHAEEGAAPLGLRPEEPRLPVKIVAISDTHGFHDRLEIPPGDVLVHSGDFCRKGTLEEFTEFLGWFEAQPHAAKVLVAGNHDMVVEKEPARCLELIPESVTYLQDSGAEINGVQFWGSPWTPIFYDWAFMLPRGNMLREKWDQIPQETDVLVTHGPPYGHGDLAPPNISEHPKVVGCLELLHAVKRVRPQVHIFGHIHGGYGVSLSDEVPHVRFANAAICTEGYEPSHAPTVLDLRNSFR
jgi:Icc-related predicted phosphoesterase